MLCCVKKKIKIKASSSSSSSLSSLKIVTSSSSSLYRFHFITFPVLSAQNFLFFYFKIKRKLFDVFVLGEKNEARNSYQNCFFSCVKLKSILMKIQKGFLLLCYRRSKRRAVGSFAATLMGPFCWPWLKQRILVKTFSWNVSDVHFLTCLSNS